MGRKIVLSESIGLQLKEFRTSYTVKAKDVAESIDKSPSYISKLEKGQIQQIDKNEFVKITNFISNSNDGYSLFCEKIAEKADANELENDLLLLNFDLMDRLIPVSTELVEYIKQRMIDLGLSPDELTSYINKNEDLTPSFFKEHRIDVDLIDKNVWLPYTEADSIDHTHSLIFLEFQTKEIDAFVNGKISKCNYILPFAMLYHILKWSYKKDGGILDENQCDKLKLEAEKILLNYKFYSLSVQARVGEQTKSFEDYSKLLSTHDIENIKLISTILNKIEFLSKLDVSYTNEKLKYIADNMEECDASFVLAYMAVPLIRIKDLNTSTKKKLLQEISELITSYSHKTNTGDNFVKY